MDNVNLQHLIGYQLQSPFCKARWTDLVDGVDDLDIKTQSDKIHVSARRNCRE